MLFPFSLFSLDSDSEVKMFYLRANLKFDVRVKGHANEADGACIKFGAVAATGVRA